jgi:4-carboxymuconolactone decarboxylase
MRSFPKLLGLLLVMGASVAGGYGLSNLSPQATSSGGPSTASATTFPKDVFPETGNRMPPIKREDLDDTGKKLYDAGGPGPAFGPQRIRLYSPSVEVYMSGVNDYLRHKAGLEPRLAELTILVTSREMDAEYVWTAHEPAALKAGLQPEIVDVIKYRKPIKGLGEKESSIIQLGREVIGKHKVSSDTFARASKLFGNQGLVNVVALMGDYAATTILLNVFDQHVRPADKPLLPIP